MNGCQTCGGFGGHHDPVAHDAEQLPNPCSTLCAGCYKCQPSDLCHGEEHAALHPWYFADCADCDERADAKEANRG